ncbi:ATP-binding protein [Streptomyces palmae]|uniref:ATP-binding protein n=1 Tax=Streptomyces palmae TaxID=1701085 RepID=UPI00315800DA
MNRLRTWPVPEGLDAARAPLRGREAELASIEERLDALARSEGGIVLVEGPAGIGRSRLLAEAAASAERRGIRVFHGAADPDGQFVPLGPLLDGLHSQAGPRPVATRLRDLATTPGQRFWLLQELEDRVRETAGDGPLLIVLDDLQWCDDLTLLTLHTIAARLTSHAILWLVAVSGGSVPPGVRTTLERLRQIGAHELVLPALGEQAIARIAEDLLGAAPDPDVLRLAGRAEGVPLLLVELLGALRNEEVVTIENGMARLSAGSVPPRRLPSVGRRLAQLSDAARELVQTVAAAGRPVTVALVAELLGRSSAALITAVRESIDADLLVERGDRLEFRHDLIREAVEACLPLSLRQALRRQAAELPVESVPAPIGPSASPAGDAEPGHRVQAERLRAAAAELAATAPEAAAELSLKALELTAEDAVERPRIIAETIPLLWQTGRPDRARELGAAALSADGLGPEAAARVHLALARLSAQFGFTEMVWQARAGASLPRIPAALRARLLGLLCLGLALAGECQAAEQALAEARESVEAAGDRAAEATVVMAESAVCFHRMEWTEAIRRADRGAALAAELGDDPSPWDPPALWHGFLLNAAGRSAEALAAAEEGAREARGQGRTATTRLWLTNRARVLLDAGRLADARASADVASAMTDEFGRGDLADITLRHAMMRVALHTNDQQAAREYAARARRMRSGGAPLVREVGSWMLALMADVEGRPDRAMAELDEVMAARAEERPALAGWLDPADTPVLVRMAVRADAYERAAQAVGLAERRAALNPELPFLAATAAHARGLLDNDLGPLLRAVRLYEDCPRTMARASALEDAGRGLVATRRFEAVPYLEAALALYTRAGAERDVTRVRRRLRAAGVRRRPSSAARAGEWPELTAAEVRVVRLVTQGLTNLQVAERLSLSPHTVSSHVRRAFTKLDLTSRAELTRLARIRDSGE